MSAEKNAQHSKTTAMRMEQFHDRWTSVGTNSGIIELKERPTPGQLRQYDIFKEFDDKLLEKIATDVSIARWKAGTILFEEGSYIDLAFYLVSGQAKIQVSRNRAQIQQGNPIFNSERTSAIPMVPDDKPQTDQAAGGTMLLTQLEKQADNVKKKTNEITFLATMDIEAAFGEEASLKPGDIFGEIGALVGWPQVVTAQTTTECEIIQIRIPALRQMKRKSTSLKEKIDKIYKDKLLLAQLKGTPLFQNCSDAFLQSLKDKFELISLEAGETITTEGEPVDSLYMVRSGFVRLSQKLGAGEMVVTYLSKGMTLGEVELLVQDTGGWVFSSSAVEHIELVKLSIEAFNQLIASFPEVEKLLWDSAVNRIKESGYSRKNIQQSEFIETALTQGLVEGNSIFTIDLDTCTRCDDCVRACADTHDGIPRFVREGNKYNNILITRACYHCEDPVCLIGCPTGAIRRASVGSVVEIVDDLCIGCNTCANNCPYDAITMFDTGETWPDNMVPEGLRGRPRLLATKCDLCYDTGHDPACVSNCPHDCAVRVGSVEEFQSLLSSKSNGKK